jgi:CDP-diacylglycerol--glycerol-3-phosphate 3-phosphatidyltransferase
MGKDILRFIPVLIIIALIRVINVVIAAYKYRTFAIIHTLGNKITGLLVFFTPVLILLHNDMVLWLVCITAAISALEETLIHITANKLNLDRLSILSR